MARNMGPNGTSSTPTHMQKGPAIASDKMPATGVRSLSTTSRAMGEKACASPDLRIHLDAKGHATSKVPCK
jgi:hypothetical protein